MQTVDQVRIDRLPVAREAAEGLVGRQAGGLIDSLGIQFDPVVVAPPDCLAEVRHLVDPAVLMGHGGIAGLQCCRQASAAIGDDEMEMMALEAALKQVLQLARNGSKVFGAPRACGPLGFLRRVHVQCFERG